MSQVELLQQRLDSMGLKIRGVTLGPNPGSADAVAREILKALGEIFPDTPV